MDVPEMVLVLLLPSFQVLKIYGAREESVDYYV